MTTTSVADVLASVSRRLRVPRGHTVLDREAFDRLTWPECNVELPGGVAGWATTTVGGSKFATWIPEPKR